jgi:hypothetical protein
LVHEQIQHPAVSWWINWRPSVRKLPPPAGGVAVVQAHCNILSLVSEEADAGTRMQACRVPAWHPEGLVLVMTEILNTLDALRHGLERGCSTHKYT